MNPNQIKARVAQRLFGAKPSPFIVALIFIGVTQLLSTLFYYSGGSQIIPDGDFSSYLDAFENNLTEPVILPTIAYVTFAVAQLVSVLLTYGFHSFSLHVCREQNASLFDLMDGFAVPIRALLIWFVSAFLSSIGFLLFIVPGFIVTYTYAMAPYLLLDHPDWSPLHCMQESRRMMRGNKKDFFLLRLSLLFWRILAVFPFTEVISRPLIDFSETSFYLELIGPAPEEDPGQEPPQEKPPWEY